MHCIAEGDDSYMGIGVVMLYWEGKLGYCLGGKSEPVGEHRLLTDVASRVSKKGLVTGFIVICMYCSLTV